MLLISILMLTLLQGSVKSENPGAESLFDSDGINQLTKEIASNAQSAADLGKAIESFDERCKKMLGELFKKDSEISEKMDIVNDRNSSTSGGLEILMEGLDDVDEKKIMIHEMVDSIKVIVENYDTLSRFSEIEKIPTRRFKEFLESVSSRKKGSGEQLKKIYKILTSESILDSLEKVFNAKNDERCNANSPQNSIYKIYTSIAGAELMGFATIVYSIKLLEKETGSEDTDSDIESLADSVNKRIKTYAGAFQGSLKNVERMIRACDPAKESDHVRENTFYEMWGLIQGISMNEWGLVYEKSCKDKCEDMNGYRAGMTECFYGKEKSVKWKRYEPSDLEKCPLSRKCYGLIHSCVTLWKSHLCKMANSTRRYVFFRDSYNKETYGKWTNCSEGVYSEYEYKSAGFLTLSACSQCWCICNDDRPQSLSVHTINLRESTSQYKYNRVVVGVRIQVKERIVQLQVKEGEIGREYSINPKTVQWRYLPKIGREIELAANVPAVRDDPDSPKEGIDFHMFKVTHVFNMNKVLLKGHRVVVGVRFVKVERNETVDDVNADVHIEIQVKSMEYNPATGKLSQGTEKWEETDVIHDSKLDIKLRLPFHTNETTTIKSKSNHYIKMEVSDRYEDASQTTLPLFDAHAVEMQPPAPLGGIGMHYRSTPEKCGFIGISGYSLDYAGFFDKSGDNESSE